MRRRHERSQSLRFLTALAVAAIAPIALAQESSDAELSAERLGADSVRLEWKGGIPTFDVYRATSPDAVVAPSHLLASTGEFSFDDLPPAGSIYYYRLDSRGECWQPQKDATADESAPGSNFGTALELRSADVLGTRRIAHLWFSLGNIPAGSVIDEATLKLDVRGETAAGTVAAHAAEEGWTEEGLSWELRPPLGVAEASASITPGATEVHWDVTELLTQWVGKPGSNLGLALVATEGTDLEAHARESGAAQAPRLCVRWHDPVLDAAAALEKSSEGPVETRFADGLAEFISAEVPVGNDDAILAALAFLEDNAALFDLDDVHAELFPDRTATREGRTAVVFARMRDGIPVSDEHVTVLGDGASILGVSSTLRRDRAYQGRLVLSPEAARAEVGVHLAAESSKYQLLGETRAYWLPDPAEIGRLLLSYRVDALSRELTSGQVLARSFFVDAEEGGIVDAIEEADEAGSKDYHLKDANHEDSITCFNMSWEQKTTWADESGMRPEYPGLPEDDPVDGTNGNASINAIFDYFDASFGWTGMDGSGGSFDAYVHWNAPGTDNAQYRKHCGNMFYGDGFATDDIVGHEFTHGVVRHTIDSPYRNQEGALNEHLADFFGSQIDLNWTIGESRRDGGADYDGDGTIDTAGAIRDMSHPPAFLDPDHMDSFIVTTFDNGGVHSNSGILNKAAFLMASGGTHRDIPVDGIGREKVGRLIFTVLSARLSGSSRFVHYGAELVRQAQSFAGVSVFTTHDTCQVINAVAAVGLGDPDTDCDGVPNPPSSDGDGDGHADSRDNCPFVANPGQEDEDGDTRGDVCDTDADGDGWPNDTDNCPLDANPSQADRDANGEGDACQDTDGDGVPDIFDLCPEFPHESRTNTDGDPLPDDCDNDDDNDSFPDANDNCPLVASATQANSDSDSYGDACDNCDFVPNEDQADCDLDGIGDACSTDRDCDGIPNDEDLCPDHEDPHNLDGDGDGVGTVCDDDEVLSGLSQAEEVFFTFVHFDLERALAIPILPCALFDCPDRIGEGFETRVTLDLARPYIARVVDDRGYVVAQLFETGAGPVTMSFLVDPQYHYRSVAGASPLQARSYRLELIAPPNSTPGQELDGSLLVESAP